MAEPAIRAHFLRLAIRRLRAVPNGKGSRIRERIGAERLAAIRAAGPTDWLPAADGVRVCDAIVEVLGEDDARAFWTELIFDSYDRGILKPLIAMASASGPGGGPRSLLSLAPRAWDLSARDCGAIELVDDGEEAGLRLSSATLHPDIARSRGFHCVFYGACKAMLDQFRSSGSIEVRREAGEVDQIIYEVRV